jgi:Gpi18-like mannosyltransferase
MSDQLNHLKNLSNNSPQNTQDTDNYETDQEQNSNFDTFNKNSIPLEILKPRSTYESIDTKKEVEFENVELGANNNNFDQTSSGYGASSFGEIDMESNQVEKTIKQMSTFPPTNQSFEESFVAPAIAFGFDQNQDRTKQKTQNPKINRSSILAQIAGFINPLFTLENLIFVAVCLIAFRVRLSFFPFISGDYGTFLKPWMEKIESGGFAAFKEAFYNYTPLYVYVLGIGVALKANFLFWVKIVSVFFDFVLSYFVAKIVAIKHPRAFKLAFMTTLVLPATLFNGSMWGQCDSIYGSFVVGSLYFLLKSKYFKSAFLFALSLCLKLQGVFFAPVFLILIVTKNLPKKFLLTVPALFVGLYLLMIFPISQGFIFGSDARPLFDSTEIRNGELVTVKTDGLLTIYSSQGKAYGNLVMGAVPNMYQWISNDKYEYFYQAGLGVALVAILLLAYYFLYNKIENVDNDVIVKLSLLSVMLVPYLLPKMHERYFFLAEIMAIVYSFWFPRKFWVGIIVSIVSMSVYISGVISGNMPEFMTREYTALWMLGIIVYVFYDLIQGLRQDKIDEELLEIKI